MTSRGNSRLYDFEILLIPEDSAAYNQLCFSWQFHFPEWAVLSLEFRWFWVILWIPNDSAPSNQLFFVWILMILSIPSDSGWFCYPEWVVFPLYGIQFYMMKTKRSVEAFYIDSFIFLDLLFLKMEVVIINKQLQWNIIHNWIYLK
jgi:hypothetical protein